MASILLCCLYPCKTAFQLPSANELKVLWNCSHAAVLTSDLRCVMPLHSFGGVVLEAQSGAQRVTNGLSVIRNYLNIRMLQSFLISWIFWWVAIFAFWDVGRRGRESTKIQNRKCTVRWLVFIKWRIRKQWNRQVGAKRLRHVALAPWSRAHFRSNDFQSFTIAVEA